MGSSRHHSVRITPKTARLRWALLSVPLWLSGAGCSDKQADNGAGGGSPAAGGVASGGSLPASGGALTGGSSSGGGGTDGSGTGGVGSGGDLASGGNLASGGTGVGGAGGLASGGSLASGGIGMGSGGLASGGDAGVGGAGAGASGGTFRVYLLIGQSNMAGGAETEPADLTQDERIQVLGYDDCPETGRVYNEWDTASPPLHACWSGGIGPGDHFAKTLIEALPAGDTIGLVPCAIPGVDIDFFVKGVVSARRGEFTIPPDNHWDSAYDWVLERARLAQDAGGVIDGIIFHQGESDSGEPNRSLWTNKVKGILEDLKQDLGVTQLPLVAGELLYSGCCRGMNDTIAQLPSVIPDAFVVSAEGLNGVDQYHFDAPGVRTLGQRYGEAMSEALGLSP